MRKNLANYMNGEEINLADMKRDVIYASSKKIKEEKVTHSKIEDDRDISKIIDIISKLPEPKKRKFSEISLRTNPKKWVLSLLNNYPDFDENIMEVLLNDFTDSMLTRMREESRYALAMLLKNELILCHSIYGEETITTNWRAIPRVLDSDNVLRYVRFVKSDDDIVVEYFERWATESFTDWLGLSQKDAFYLFGGKYRIYSKIENIDVVLEFTEEQLDRWLKEHPEIIRRREIKLANPISALLINQIRVGKKKYEDVGDFIQDFTAEKYNIKHYREKFKEVTSPPPRRDKEPKSTGPIDLYLYKFYDEKDVVVKKGDQEEVIVIEKTNPNIDMLFVCEHIKIRSSYLDDILTRFINGETIRIIHVGMNIAPEPIKIRNMEIWNKLEITELTKLLISYYHETKLQDKCLSRILEFAIFKTLSEANRDTHIYYFLDPFTDFGTKFLNP